MPTYNFICPRCGTPFEALLAISERDRDDVECPECGHRGARRGVSAPNLVSGSGHTAAAPASFPT